MLHQYDNYNVKIFIVVVNLYHKGEIMGMCKSCGEVFGSADLVKGICKTCNENIVKAEQEEQAKNPVSNPLLMACKVCKKEISKTAKQCPYCGESYENITAIQQEEKQEMTPEKYVAEAGKSRITSFILTLILGPLGLLYSSVVGGVIMIVVAIGLGSVTGGVGGLLLWPVSVIMGDSFTYNYNKRLLAQAKFMKK